MKALKKGQRWWIAPLSRMATWLEAEIAAAEIALGLADRALDAATLARWAAANLDVVTLARWAAANL